jgi:hypothetical protein
LSLQDDEGKGRPSTSRIEELMEVIQKCVWMLEEMTEINRQTVGIHCVRPEFQESGSWYLLHDNALAHSSGVVSKFLAK